MKAFSFFNRYTVILTDSGNIHLRWESYRTPDPSMEQFFHMLWSCGLLSEEVGTRSNPGYLIKSQGLSGRKDYYWRECQYFGRDMMVPVRDHHILHISCNNKINEGCLAYLTDLQEIFSSEKMSFERPLSYKKVEVLPIQWHGFLEEEKPVSMHLGGHTRRRRLDE